MKDKEKIAKIRKWAQDYQAKIATKERYEDIKDEYRGHKTILKELQEFLKLLDK